MIERPETAPAIIPAMLLRFLFRPAVRCGSTILMDGPGDGIGHAPSPYRTPTHTLMPLAGDRMFYAAEIHGLRGDPGRDCVLSKSEKHTLYPTF